MNDEDLIKVDDEFMGGEVIVASAYSNGDLKVGVKPISTGPNPDDYLYLTVKPTVTVAKLREILAAIGVTLP